MTVIQMSDRELTRLRVMIDLSDGRLTLEAAGTLMGIGRRQVFAFVGPLRPVADRVVSRKRGRASNRRHGETFRRTVLALVREHYPDFGPTLAAEKLAERHGLRLGVETLRQWMMADGLWIDRRHRLPSPHQPRRRRECLGELVQIDGSEHAWFEDRGPMCTLLAFVDDATSRLMQLRFVASESAFDYFRATRDYLETHGKPVAFYSDKHSIFRVNNGEGGDRVTQFGRALAELNIDIICANSPQAKGRVERAFGTLQDRLVKELRLAGIATSRRRMPGCRISSPVTTRVRPRTGERQGPAPEADRRGRSGRDPGLAGGADRDAQPHAALRPDDADPGSDAAGARVWPARRSRW